MWHTPEGDRVLAGPERELFHVGLATLWDTVEMFDDEEEVDLTGVAVFDDLSKPERVALLALVAKALTDEAEPCPKLVAVNEATVAAIYAHILTLVEMELDTPTDGTEETWFGPADEPAVLVQELVLAAARHVELDFEHLQLDNGRESLEDWSYLIDELLDRILWDRDYEATETFLDLDPALAAVIKEQYGAADDYFRATAAECTSESLETSRAALRRICRGPGA